MHAHRVMGYSALLVAGANLFDSWINVDLFHQQNRKIIAPVPGNPWTEDHVHITNEAVYAQEG